jgi:hypothetical protein
LSEGDSLKSQPEKIRPQLLSGRRTSTWTKAPVNFSSSQGAVASHARSRTMTSFHRTDCPGRSVTFWTIPLRLLRIPMTATRCAIGVTPPCPAAVAGTLDLTETFSLC